MNINRGGGGAGGRGSWPHLQTADIRLTDNKSGWRRNILLTFYSGSGSGFVVGGWRNVLRHSFVEGTLGSRGGQGRCERIGEFSLSVVGWFAILAWLVLLFCGAKRE